MISSIGSTLNPSALREYWQLIVAGSFTIGVSGITAWAFGRVFLRYESRRVFRPVQLAIAFPNSVAFPLLLMGALCEQDDINRCVVWWPFQNNSAPKYYPHPRKFPMHSEMALTCFNRACQSNHRKISHRVRPITLLLRSQHLNGVDMCAVVKYVSKTVSISTLRPKNDVTSAYIHTVHGTWRFPISPPNGPAHQTPFHLPPPSILHAIYSGLTPVILMMRMSALLKPRA